MVENPNVVSAEIIVGWGLAGASLAWQFYFAQKNFMVYDSMENHATRTAAGLVNPIVFKRLNMSWKADVLMPYANDFYTKIEGELMVKLLSRQPIFRVFRDFEEENDWSARQGDDRFKSILKTPEMDSLPPSNLIPHKFGMGEVVTFGNLNTLLFLTASKQFFLAKGIEFRAAYFEYESAKSLKKNVFFCEGFGLKKNPYFNYLPLNGTHGEVLIIRTKGYNFAGIVNKNMFVLKIDEYIYKVGATYNWELKEPITTEAARVDLIERLDSFTDFEYEIIDQQAGVRPTVIDRRPLLGRHTVYKNLYLFNGLGTKGVMLSPFFSAEIFALSSAEKPVDPEVDILRYAHLLKD